MLPYLDIPFQHASSKILKAMRRPAAEAKTLQRIRAWRDAVPELTIRSTFIVGFPGETEQDFNYCSTGSKRPSSTASVASATSPYKTPRRTRCRTPCPRN